MSNRVNDLNGTLVSNYILKMYLLAYNISILRMNSQGYQKVYDVPYYSNSTTFEELNAIKSTGRMLLKFQLVQKFLFSLSF